MHSKRDDLQCWRGFSILGVLLYHVWPTNFPNGYIGVDIFFVLSGYLMAMIFPAGREIEVKDLKTFYFRRIKRIVPVYLVIILMTLFFLARSTLLREYKEIKTDSKWAVGFISNLQDGFTKLNYFDVESKYRFFRHCWSLAVEMQFYLIFPFIGFLRTKINKQIYQLIMLIIFLTSITYQLASDNPITKYESVFCRIWQFISGILAYSVTIKPFPEITYGLLVINIGLIFIPIEINYSIITLLAVICASSTIALSNSESHPFTKFIPNLNIYQNFIFLGDISYVLYLIHWPIVTYAVSLSVKGRINFYDGIHIAVTCVAFAIFAHKFIEKPLLNFCNDIKKLTVVLGILYLSVFLLPELFKQIAFDPSFPSETTLNVLNVAQKLNKPIKLPENWSRKNDVEVSEWMIKKRLKLDAYLKCSYKQSVHLPEISDYLDYCEYNVNSEATLTAMIVGNSYAINLHYAILKNPAFRKVILFYSVGCQFPYVDKEKKHCKKAADAMKRLIGEVEPDIVYLFQAYGGYMYSPLEKNWKKDWRFKKWNETFQFIQKHSSAVIINEEQINFKMEVAAEFSKRKFHGILFDGKIKTPKKGQHLSNRLSAIHCPKCFWFDFKSVFCGRNFCNSLDTETGLPLYHDHIHLSVFGIKKIKPNIDKVTSKAVAFIKKRKF